MEMRWLTVSGEDRDIFLQGQLSNDIYALTVNNWQLAAYCSPQGKVLAVIWLWRDAEQVWLGMPADIIDQVAKRLQMFVLRSKVVITRQNVACTAVATIVKSAGERRVTPVDDGSILLAGTAGVDLFIGQHAVEEEMSPAQWRAARIRAGIAQVHMQTTDTFLPQALGLVQAGAVSFHKGCYVGQENVARLHYKSQTRRHLAVAESTGYVAGQAGDVIYSAEQRGGIVLDVGMDEQGSIIQAVLSERLLGAPLRLDGCDEVLYFKHCYQLE